MDSDNVAPAGRIIPIPPDPPRHIIVYRFSEAPADLRDLSTNGGDEDWLAVVPPNFGYVPWLEEGGRFGVCCVHEYDHPDQIWHRGCKVLIGCHA